MSRPLSDIVELCWVVIGLAFVVGMMVGVSLTRRKP